MSSLHELDALSGMDLVSVFRLLQDMTLKGVYLEYARKKREMIPWNLPWPIIYDPAEGEWTPERISAGFYLLTQLSEVRKLVESTAVGYLTGKGHVFEPSPDEDESDGSDEDDSDDENSVALLEEIPCTCKYLPLAIYFPDDQKALDCLDKMKASCHDDVNANLRRCMETYEEAFDSAVYLCELVGSPEQAQKVKDALNLIPASTRQLAREVAGVQQLHLEPEQE